MVQRLVDGEKWIQYAFVIFIGTGYGRDISTMLRKKIPSSIQLSIKVSQPCKKMIFTRAHSLNGMETTIFVMMPWSH